MPGKKIFEVALILSAVDNASRIIERLNQNAKNNFDKMSAHAFHTGLHAAEFGLSILEPLSELTEAAEADEIAGRRLNKAFLNAGDKTGEASKQAQEYAEKLEVQIGQEKEGIEMVQAKLAAFKNVSSETSRMSGLFDRATKSAYDMAAGGFGEAQSNALLLGKALQDPANQAAKLVRTGTLNKSDIGLIKQIQAAKGLGAAQEYVLSRIEKKFKGQSEATVTGTQRMKAEFRQIEVTLGQQLLPMFERLVAKIGHIVSKLKEWTKEHPTLIGGGLKLVAVIGGISMAISGAAFVFGGFFKVLSVGRSIMMAARTAQAAFTVAQVAGTGITGGMTAAVTALNLAFLANPITWVVLAVVALIGVGYLLIKNWAKIKVFFSDLWASVLGIFKRFFEVINKTFLKYTPVMLIYNNWNKIVGFFSGLWDKVKAVFMAYFGFFFGLYKKFWDFGVNIVSGLWEGIKVKLTPLYNFVKGIGEKIAKTFKYILGINSPSKVFMEFGTNITEGASKGIQKGAPAAIAAAKSMGKGISPVTGKSGGTGGGITIHFAPVISGVGNSSDILAELKKYTPQLIREIEAIMQRKQRLSF